MIKSPWAHGASTMAPAAALFIALAAPPGAAWAQSGCEASYTVQAGDTLAGIAERCGTTVEELAEANAVIADPARITVGWELTVPGAGPSAGPAASLGPESEVRAPARGEDAQAALSQGSYDVRPGDSFASIATALQVPMRALMAVNEGVDPFGLRPGQTLRLPAGTATSSEETASDKTAADGQPAEPEGAPGRPDAAGSAAATRETVPNAREARPEHEPEKPGAAERLMLEGRVRSGAECPVLETPEGEVYSLVSAEYGFLPGEYVEIEGETVVASFCVQGKATVRVTSMTAVPAPQGG